MTQMDNFKLDEVYGVWLTPWYTTPAGIAILLIALMVVFLLIALVVWHIRKPRLVSEIECMRLRVNQLKKKCDNHEVTQTDIPAVYDTLSKAFTVYAKDIAGLPAGLSHEQRFEAIKDHFKDARMVQSVWEFLDNEQNVRYAHSEIMLNRAEQDVSLLKELIDQSNEQKKIT